MVAEALAELSYFQIVQYVLLALVLYVVGFVATKLLFFRKFIVDMNGKVFPGQPSNFFGGHIPLLLSRRADGRVSTALWEVMMATQHTDIMGLRFPTQDLLVLASPEYIKPVLSASHAKFPKGQKYQAMEAALGLGLVTSNGDMWKTHRALISPAFHAENLKHMVKAFSNHAAELVEVWKEQIAALPATQQNKGLSLSFHYWMSAITADVICDAGFGYKFNALRSDRTAFAADMETVLAETGMRFRQPFPFMWYFPPWRVRKFYKALSNLRGVVDAVMTQRFMERRGETARDPNRMVDLLDMMIDAKDDATGQGLTGQALVDQVMTFLGAGHETTANALCWTVYELCQHPEVLQKMREEISTVLDDRAPTYEDIAKLDYVNMVFKESLRLHPTVGIIGRDCPEGLEIPGYSFSPKKVRVVFNITALHRNPAVWDRPMEFIPERFDPNWPQYRKIDPFAFLPFSFGPRNCIGQRFAQFEAVVILVMMVRSFDFALQSNEPVDVEEAITIRPRGGLPVFVTLRKN